jgi:hypothetical protein
MPEFAASFHLVEISPPTSPVVIACYAAQLIRFWLHYIPSRPPSGAQQALAKLAG